MSEKLRFAVAGIVQESNTFAPGLSTLSDFAVEQGSAVLDSRGSNTEVGGFLDGLRELGVEAVPLISAWAVSAGPVNEETFSELSRRLLESIPAAKFDGVLLALHGAWLGKGLPSADAEFAMRVRRAVGPDLPIVITHDFHANVSAKLLEHVQGVVGYRTYPHVDMAETGRKAAYLLHKIVTERIRPRTYWLDVPLLAPPQRATTDQPPIQDVLARLDEDLPGEVTLSSSFFCVQPWLDLAGVRSGFLVVARSEDESIPGVMRGIADDLWRQRGELQVDWTEPAELVQRVKREGKRPVIVSEAYDATSGGAPGDHPGLLSTLHPDRDRVAACLYMVDARVAAAARQLGVGGEYRGPLGASLDHRFGAPVEIRARISGTSDGIFSNQGPVFHGRKLDMGVTATLEAGGLKIVVASRAVMTVDPELYRSQGVEPAEQEIVAVKSPTLFRPGYQSMLGQVLHLDMAGVCRGNLEKVPYKNIGRPIWPLDTFDWDARGQRVQVFRS